MEIQSGNNLIFISMINRDGSGTTPVSQEYIEVLKKQNFAMRRLSISEDTFIALGFNSFVVKIKKQQESIDTKEQATLREVWNAARKHFTNEPYIHYSFRDFDEWFEKEKLKK